MMMTVMMTVMVVMMMTVVMTVMIMVMKTMMTKTMITWHIWHRCMKLICRIGNGFPPWSIWRQSQVNDDGGDGDDDINGDEDCITLHSV